MKTIHPYFSILGTLTKSGIRYSVVGQMGASFYGSDQTTYDLDVFAEPNEKNISKLRALLKKKGLAEVVIYQGQQVKPAPTNKEVIHKQMTLLFADAYGITIDVLTSISGVDFKQLWKNKKIFEIQGQKVYVASLEHIIHSKKKANRAKDKLHLARLQELLKQQAS